MLGPRGSRRNSGVVLKTKCMRLANPVTSEPGTGWHARTKQWSVRLTLPVGKCINRWTPQTFLTAGKSSDPLNNLPKSSSGRTRASNKARDHSLPTGSLDELEATHSKTPSRNNSWTSFPNTGLQHSRKKRLQFNYSNKKRTQSLAVPLETLLKSLLI